MLKHRIRKSALIISNKVSDLVKFLLKDEAVSGKFLLIAAIAAIAITNSPWQHWYEALWTRNVSIDFGGVGVSETFRHWINEGLMAIFFLVISLEIKREIVRGELRSMRMAAAPIAAAIGGVLVPIGIYAFLNAGQGGADGWGIPMTTDTAFSVGLLALLGRRIPLSLKVFLLTATVVDDVAAIGAIAVFYNDHVHVVPLLAAGGLLAVILGLHWVRLLRLSTFVLLGIGLWLAVHESGVHASITGVVLGLAAPIVARRRKGAIAERLERTLIPVSTFIVMPLFALANAGVPFSWNVFASPEAAFVGAGVAAGLVIGKMTGIFGGAWLIVRLGIGAKPDGVRWGHIAGVGLLSGVGFTLSIFIAELAFDNQQLINAAKVAIFGASLLSAVIGLAWLRFLRREEHPTLPS